MLRSLVLTVVLFLLAGCGQPAKPVIPYVLLCADCEAEGMPANIWRDAAASKRACTLDWGTRVTVTDTQGRMLFIDSATCDGWISENLVRATSSK